MAFKSILRDLTERTGAKGAIMVDWEGEAVSSFTESKDLDLPLIGAHHRLVLDHIKDAATRHAGGGSVKDAFISAGDSKITISPIKEGYCLVVVTKKTDPAGKVLLESRKAIRRIEEEMG